MMLAWKYLYDLVSVDGGADAAEECEIDGI